MTFGLPAGMGGVIDRVWFSLVLRSIDGPPLGWVCRPMIPPLVRPKHFLCLPRLIKQEHWLLGLGKRLFVPAVYR